MANSGIPDGPPPGVDPGPQFYGMTQQSGAAGPRGRVFLPALDSDALGYRVSAYDILENSPAGLVWTFKYFDGGGYAPRSVPLVRPRQRPRPSLCLSVVAQRTDALRDPRFS